MENKELIVRGLLRPVRLDKYISDNLDISRNQIQKLLDDNLIKVNKEVVKSSYKVKENDLIDIIIPDPKEINFNPQNLDIQIYYEDDYLAVIEKPAGIPVHFSKGHEDLSLVNGLLYQFEGLSSINGEYRSGIVHRLDKDTSGLLIIAKDNKVHDKLSLMFKNRELTKKYLTIVKGRLKKEKGLIENYIGRNPKYRKQMTVLNSLNKTAKKAISEYEVLDYNDNFSLVEVNIKTGRTHQIRVHMKHINHPIVGDSLYGNGKGFDKQMLHARYLKFIHPITNETIEIISRLPNDFKKALKQTKLKDIDELN